jgi:hypothetical protein
VTNASTVANDSAIFSELKDERSDDEEEVVEKAKALKGEKAN